MGTAKSRMSSGWGCPVRESSRASLSWGTKSSTGTRPGAQPSLDPGQEVGTASLEGPFQGKPFHGSVIVELAWNWQARICD